MSEPRIIIAEVLSLTSEVRVDVPTDRAGVLVEFANGDLLQLPTVERCFVLSIQSLRKDASRLSAREIVPMKLWSFTADYAMMVLSMSKHMPPTLIRRAFTSLRQKTDQPFNSLFDQMVDVLSGLGMENIPVENRDFVRLASADVMRMHRMSMRSEDERGDFAAEPPHA